MTNAVSTQDDAILRSLHPECTDWQALGPTTRDAAIRAAAAAAESDKHKRAAAWSKGFNRRTFLKAGMGVGVAALGNQLVTSRVSYAAADTLSTGTMVVIFLRGGLDGLSLLVPDNDPYLLDKRPDILARSSATHALIPMGRGFGLHPSMAPLNGLIQQGKLAVVPAVSTPDLTRTHFQAQDCLERGSSTSLTTGWLDRVLEVAGAGTTFRSVAVGGTLPRSLMGNSGSLAMYNLDSLKINVDDDEVGATRDALETLYTGHRPPDRGAGEPRPRRSRHGQGDSRRPAPQPGDHLPGGQQLRRRIVVPRRTHQGRRGRARRVHRRRRLGHPHRDGHRRRRRHEAAARRARRLPEGVHRRPRPDLDSTTIVTMSEFGRRVEQNASGGTDHGHGGAVLVIGGGVSGGVKGRWDGLSDLSVANDEGDVPGWNDYRDILTEVVTKRLDISQGAMASVFPAWSPSAIGVMA